MIKNMQIIITGNVQGVGFRAFIRNRALKNDICGWVRNLDDGSVEALLSGSQVMAQNGMGSGSPVIVNNVDNSQRNPVVSNQATPVSYTHLTLPTNREV